jgi:hypothetical protein
VNTLADTVNPAHAAKRSAARTRSAMVGVKDRVMGSAQQSASGLTSAAGEKASAAQGELRRQAAGNPLAVGLIALGIGWLVGSLLPASPAEEQAAVRVKEAAVPAVTSAAKEAAASLQDPAQQAADAVKATAADAAATVKDESASAARDVRDQAQTARDTVTDSRR